MGAEMSKEIERRRRDEGPLMRDLVGTAQEDKPASDEVREYEKYRPDGTVRERGQVRTRRYAR